MKRSDVLRFMASQLSRLGVTYPVYEVYLHIGNSPMLTAGRTLFITGNTDQTGITKFFNQYKIPINDTDIRTYQSESELLASSLISASASDLSTNWRGRLISWEQIGEIDNDTKFKERILASYWRFIVTKRNNDYFARHEISPCYYNPGHSTGGHSDFRGGLDSFVQYLGNLRDRWQIDLDFDRIVLFTRIEPEKQFTRCNPAFFPGNYISYRDFSQYVTTHGEGAVKNEMYNALSAQL